MTNLHRTKRESSSELGLTMKAKSIDDLLDLMYTSEMGSDLALEVLDEIIRRAALYTELSTRVQDLESVISNKAAKVLMLAPDPSNKGH